MHEAHALWFEALFTRVPKQHREVLRRINVTRARTFSTELAGGGQERAEVADAGLREPLTTRNDGGAGLRKRGVRDDEVGFAFVFERELLDVACENAAAVSPAIVLGVARGEGSRLLRDVDKCNVRCCIKLHEREAHRADPRAEVERPLRVLAGRGEACEQKRVDVHAVAVAALRLLDEHASAEEEVSGRLGHEGRTSMGVWPPRVT